MAGDGMDLGAGRGVVTADVWASLAAGALGDGVFVTSIAGEIQWCNEEAARILQFPVERLVGENLYAFLDDDDLELALQGLEFLEVTGDAVTPAIYHPRTASGVRIATEVTAAVATDPTGERCLVVGARPAGHQDAMTVIFDRLSRGEPFDAVVADVLDDVIRRWPGHLAGLCVGVDGRRRVLGQLPRAVRTLLVDPTPAGGLPWHEAVERVESVVGDVDDLPPPVASVLRTAGVVSVLAVPLVDPVEMEPCLVFLATGEAPVGLRAFRSTSPTTLILRFAVQREWFLRQLREAAATDSLTGLVNRSAFFDHLEAALAGGEPFALLYVDLDDFKPVNDRLGHAAGDLVLVEQARRMRTLVREGDVVGRLGGDELLLLCRSVVDAAAAVAVGERVVAAAAAPIDIDGEEVRVGASVGVVLHEHGRDPDALVERADRALYRAKATGKRRVVLAPARKDDDGSC